MGFFWPSAIILAIAYFYRKYMKIVQSVAHIPGPPILPFFGNALKALCNTSSDTPALSKEWSDKYGSTYRLMLGSRVFVFTENPEDVKAILKSNLEKAGEYDLLKDAARDGLITSSGSKWASRRKLLTPAFHFNNLKVFAETFDKNSEILVENLKDYGSINILPTLKRCALDNICGKLDKNRFLFVCLFIFKCCS